MPRSFSHALCTTLAAMVAVFLLSGPAHARDQAAADQPLLGRLAFVEPALRRVTILPDGEARLLELFVGDDTEVRQGDRELTLADLVILVGRRVTVRYRVVDDRRIVESVIVEPE